MYRRVPNPKQLVAPRQVKAVPMRRRVIAESKVRDNRPKSISSPANSIFLTGGIGDIFAVESYIPKTQRPIISSIFYATRKAKEIIPLFSALQNYSGLQQQFEVWDNFNNFWCFYSKEHCMNHMRSARKKYPVEVQLAQDYSIIPVFQRIRAKTLPFVGSSFLQQNVADISKFNLPSRYIFIAPFSTDKRLSLRDYQPDDWHETLRFLQIIDAVGIVVNTGTESVPGHERLVNLSNQTTGPEAIEILKGGCGYHGIDSCFSVLAAQLFAFPYLMVKSVNPFCYSSANCYYPTQNTLNFLMPSIQIGQ